MKIILENNIQKLIPSIDENWLLDKADLEKPEEERYYFKFAYLPPSMTLGQCEEEYIEIEGTENDNN